ncbi:MAG: hypothetical protein ACT4P1_12280 [Sporichthyaceae bacterium]
MTTIPFRRLPSEAAPWERTALLEDVIPDATAAEAAALRALLSLAGGPTRPAELSGEAAAVAAFRAAQPAPAAGTSWTRSTRAALLTVKTLAASLVLASVGGVALAATGTPIPFLDSPTPQLERPVAPKGADAREVSGDAGPAPEADPADAVSGPVRPVDAAPGKSAEALKKAAQKAAAKGKSAQAHENAAQKVAEKGRSAEAGESAAEKAAEKGRSAEAREDAADGVPGTDTATQAQENAADKAPSKASDKTVDQLRPGQTK